MENTVLLEKMKSLSEILDSMSEDEVRSALNWYLSRRPGETEVPKVFYKRYSIPWFF